MMGRVTLREVRKALAAAKAREAKGSATSPTVEELESLVRVFERQAAEKGAEADAGGRRGSRRSARSHGPRRR